MRTIQRMMRRFQLSQPRARGERGREGAIAIEFALIAPVLLLILFGIIEFGSVMYVRHVMFFAAREAARSYVTGTSATTSAAVDVAKTALSDGNAAGDFSVSATASGLGTDSGLITVTISTPMSDAALVNALPNNLLGDSNLTASATMYLDGSSTNSASCGKKKGSCSSKKKTSSSSSKKKS